MSRRQIHHAKRLHCLYNRYLFLSINNDSSSSKNNNSVLPVW
jgi:hypothetical protein